MSKKSLETFDQIKNWETPIPKEVQQKAIQALENGKVVYFPSLPFQLNNSELSLLSPEKVDPKSKNISYDIRSDKLGGAICAATEEEVFKQLIKRYALNSRKLIEKLFPGYSNYLNQARTSLRPVEIAGRKAPSYRKDDTLLHVDSFPATPVKGERIMRIFTNVNPAGKPRVWRVGEPFENVVKQFAPKVPFQIPGYSAFMNALGITKGYRTAYDHYMLNIHDKMKGDQKYQQTVQNEEILFPSGSTWIVYTDQVSHAAMAGQHVFEQTFYIPVEGLYDKETSPLRTLERFLNKKLV